ncbi:MAG: ComF family protein [Alphaproteobacteria bacterium]|jgi:ComF family protein
MWPLLRRYPSLSSARAAVLYDDGSRNLILHLKHADALAGVPVLARWMQLAGASILAEADYLLPVPLHWTRLFKRRYNQSAELARALARLADVPALPDGLVRPAKTPSQGGLSRHGRQENVRDAFAVKDRYRSRINGAKIVLIDDVITTGATLDACAAVLLDTGAVCVDAITLARVDHGAPLS